MRRDPIGNPLAGAPKIEENETLIKYNSLIQNKDNVSNFNNNELIKVIIKILNDRLNVLTDILIYSDPNDIANQGWIRGEISEIKNILQYMIIK